MPEANRHDLELSGCTPEPLMAYLKAMGILRLVSEQKDKGARGWWKSDVFWLRSAVLFGDTKTDDAKRDALASFFLEEYKPTPIVVPWTGSDFFGVNPDGKPVPFAKTPTATAVIEAFLVSTTDRLAPYRKVIKATLNAMTEIGVTNKEDIDPKKSKAAKRRKAVFFSRLRQSLDDNVLGWIDAAGLCADDLRFSALLGSGGGSDGNTHFSDNFMQNLWDVLPDFDAQRKVNKKNGQTPSASDMSTRFLSSALYEDTAVQLIQKRTSSLYDSGAVGGPNATQGMERDSISNPWNVILGLEGTVCFAGATAKRLAARAPGDAAFPFQVTASVTLSDRMADKEQAGKEIWLPVWSRPAHTDEVLALLREGRAQRGPRPAASGVDMARAVATLGIDRGIESFRRYAVVKGRVGGGNYNTAAALGRFEVREQSAAGLLRQIDPWLDCFRRAAGDKNAPPRFGSALGRIDSAIFDFCKYGGPTFFQRIVVALGRAERELALTPGKVGQSKTKSIPLAGLSADWIAAADDGSPEFDIALALARIRGEPDKPGEKPKVGPFRANLEPVTVWYDKQEGKQKASWAEKDRAVVWNAAELATNLANVLQRRMMDGTRAGCECLPLASRSIVPLVTAAGFIAGDLDDERVEQLIWALMLIDARHDKPRDRAEQSRDRQGAGIQGARGCYLRASRPLPRAYTLLKLLFLPRPLAVDRANDKLHWRLARNGESGIVIRPEPRVLPLLRAGRIGEACQIAAQRLRVSGLSPMPGPLPTGVTRDDEWSELTRDPRRAQRLAATLLIPVSSKTVDHLVHLVCRADDSAAAEALAVSAEGESE